MGRGISLDKAEKLRDRSTEIVEHRRDAEEIIASLREKVPHLANLLTVPAMTPRAQRPR